MHKVISISLNGNAYQLEEAGYEALRAYLTRAEQQLAANPDRGEILADLEQAIADRCQARLGAHKTVVAAGEVAQILDEMGPVDSGNASGTGTSANAAPADSDTKTETETAAPKRLYRIQQGAIVGGVCTGVAEYFGIDVTIVRIGFVAASLLTKGAAIVAYIVAMFVIPEAATPEQVTGAPPLNAKDVINRARARSVATGREWRRQWRREQRAWRRQWPASAPLAYGPPPLAAAMLPLFGLVHMALFLLMIAMLISLVNTGAILNWQLPPEIPVWAGALILLVAYQFVLSPIRAAQHWTWYPGGPASAPFAFWNAIAWLIGIAFAIWLASDHIPEIREFLQRLPDLFRDFGLAMRDLFAR